jgi:hypothetical protein
VVIRPIVLQDTAVLLSPISQDQVIAPTSHFFQMALKLVLIATASMEPPAQTIKCAAQMVLVLPTWRHAVVPIKASVRQGIAVLRRPVNQEVTVPARPF